MIVFHLIPCEQIYLTPNNEINCSFRIIANHNYTSVIHQFSLVKPKKQEFVYKKGRYSINNMANHPSTQIVPEKHYCQHYGSRSKPKTKWKNQTHQRKQNKQPLPKPYLCLQIRFLKQLKFEFFPNLCFLLQH